MTNAEAAWVRERAWTKAMRKTYRSVPAVLTTCPCEYGPCGHCSAGHHTDCPYEKPNNAQWAADRADVPAGWLTWPDKGVPNLGGTESWQVWETGVRHDGRCNCYLAGHHGALNQPSADPHKGRQTTIYDFLNDPATN
ncbi:DUF6248 family natural product biosynthesis protein [Actinomyces sp.]|uniref:DUF6248 family natural product biosynthesis protein n=1 Tax=Actinomyces sp. TaxID=29317 RepID=UPI0026DB5F56|nr:DUF6248 family natural product biosynthesis protein [Actinomyces sp.]MDO4900856.1 DUF6248 family natural product biosynthesis protein [Actinomyces sp.]